MTTEEFIQHLEELDAEGKPDQLLEFANEHGPNLLDSMTREQRREASTLAERAIMLVDLREAARQHA